MEKIGNFHWRWLFIILTWMFVQPALAAVQVQAFVDRNEIGLGDTFQLTVSVSSSDSVDVSEPRVPNIDGFDLLNSWTSSSTSSKLVQGPGGMQFETVRRQDFNYMLSPKKAGRLQIPAFEVVVDGKNYLTKPLHIEISKQGSGAGQPPQQMPGFEDMDEAEQMFNQLLQRNFGQRPGQRIPPSMGGGGAGSGGATNFVPKNANEAFQIHAEVDKTDVYEGEQVTVSWYIFTRGNIIALDRLKFPDLRGFWKEIIEEVPALNFTQEVINGIPYRKALLASHALFPIKPGTSYVDEYKVKASVQLPSNPFGAFGFGQAYTYTRSSEKIKINVKPLPTEGRPQDFAGAVGNFEVTSSVEGREFPVNQPFSLKIRFEGEGNAKLIELPGIDFPGILEKYDTKSESKFFKNGKSYKEFEVLLIPRQEGEVIIPGISVSIFDPRTQRYNSKNTQPITVKIISGGQGATLGSNRLSDKAKAVEKKNELPNIIPTEKFYTNYSASAKNWGLGFLYLVIFAGLYFHARNQLGWGQKRRNLYSDVHKRFKKLEPLISSGSWKDAGVQLTNIYYFTLGEISGQGGANLELKKLLDLMPPSVRRELGEELNKAIEHCQTLSFAPEEVVGRLKEKENLKKFFDDSKKLLDQAIALSDEAEQE